MASPTETTKDTLIDLRDNQQLSWAKVAGALGLSSPGAARRAYSNLVRPHAESVLATTARTKSGLTPLDLTGLALDAVRAAITGKTITVERKTGTELITCAKVTSVKGDTINFNDGNKARSVKASAVVAAQ
jgi:hypothetical protein